MKWQYSAVLILEGRLRGTHCFSTVEVSYLVSHYLWWKERCAWKLHGEMVFSGKYCRNVVLRVGQKVLRRRESMRSQGPRNFCYPLYFPSYVYTIQIVFSIHHFPPLCCILCFFIAIVFFFFVHFDLFFTFRWTILHLLKGACVLLKPTKATSEVKIRHD